MLHAHLRVDRCVWGALAYIARNVVRHKVFLVLVGGCIHGRAGQPGLALSSRGAGTTDRAGDVQIGC